MDRQVAARKAAQRIATKSLGMAAGRPVSVPVIRARKAPIFGRLAGSK
jgi:hypothetical protein